MRATRLAMGALFTLAVLVAACASTAPFVAPPGRHDDKNASPLEKAWRACDEGLAKAKAEPRHTALPTADQATTMIVEVGPDPSPSADEKLALTALRGQYARFRDCYLPELRAMPTLATTATIDLWFEIDGTVRGDRVHVSGDAPAAMQACIARAVSAMRMSSAPKEGLSVSYPLVFCGDDSLR